MCVCVCVCVCVCESINISFIVFWDLVYNLYQLADPLSGAEGGSNVPMSWMPTAVKHEEEEAVEDEEEGRCNFPRGVFF